MKKIFLIAEIGINHNGDVNIAKQLIDISKEAGFDAVKFQKRTIDVVYSKEVLDSPRESPWGTTQRDQKNGLEFSTNEYDEIDQYCKKKNIEWFASAWDVKSLELLDKYKLSYNKIASAMIIDKNFLSEVAKRQKYTFISTGMSTIEDIDEAVKIFNNYRCKFELMHCVSDYPMSPEDANLKTIEAIKQRYKCNVGYSGHESGLSVSLAASMLGISSLERHITLDRSMYGSDQSVSLEPSGMKKLINNIKKMHLAIGEEKLGNITKKEIEISRKLRSHIKL